MFNPLKKILKLNNKGVSLVELVCAIAILSLLGVITTSVLSISSNTYMRGTAEVEIQTEQQLVHNLIRDMLIDATSDVTFEDGVLSIKQNDITHVIQHSPEDQKIYYYNSSDPANRQVMGEKISDFYADVSDFESNGIVTLDIDYIETMSNSVRPSVFTVTTRNGRYEETPVAASIMALTDVILEPNQGYQLTATALGVEDDTLKWTVGLNRDESTNITDEGYITIGKNETANAVIVQVETAEKDEDNNPKASTFITVWIRRVNEIPLSVVCTEGIEKKQNAVYKLTPVIIGQNLNKSDGASYDFDYVDPYQVEWDIQCTNNNLYEKISESDNELIIKLKKDIQMGELLTVKAIAKHPAGTNKTNEAYDNVFSKWSLIADCKYVDLIDGGMKRNTNQKQGMFTQDFDNMATNELSKKYEYRFKPTDSNDWSIWYQNITGNANDNMEINLRPDVTAAMIYNKDYDIQIRISIIDDEGNTVWPITGVPRDNYIIDATMSRVRIAFKSTMLDFNNCNGGNAVKEITVYPGNPFDLFEFEKAVGYEDDIIKNKLDYIVERNVDGEWKSVPQNQVSVQTGPACKLKFENNYIPGSYRVKVVSRDMDKYIIQENGEPKKLTEKEDFILYNEETNEGIYYFNVK